MTVDLLSIINIEGKSLSQKGEIDFSDKNEFDVRFPNPVIVDATFTVLYEGISLKAKVFADLVYVCDRCGEEFSGSLEFEFEEILKKEASVQDADDPNPDVILFSGSCVELDEIVYKNLFMNIPTKKLCNTDCKGLCPQCGKNLNKGDCGCTASETDPRFDVLDKFFE